MDGICELAIHSYVYIYIYIGIVSLTQNILNKQIDKQEANK